MKLSIEVGDTTTEWLDGNRQVQPIFRWPGGKRWLTHRLLGLVPPTFRGCYYEPFFGGGALFFRLRPARAVISDRNAELMAAYRVVKDTPLKLEAALRALPAGSEAFYEIRGRVPANPVERAARFIYLTTNGFNGIYRVNRRGEFNVPYGGRDYQLGGAGSLSAHSLALRTATILDGDFVDALKGAGAGDLVYLDPPYTVAHSNNGFVKYNAKVFQWDDQERLARVANDLAHKGAYVIVSNAQHESIARLYRGFRAIELPRMSVMAPTADRRIAIHEVVYTNRPDIEEPA